MRRSLPLLIGVAVTMLAGCVDKREVCAQANVGNLSDKQLKETYQKLGIEKPYSVGSRYSRKTNGARIFRYCEFYKK